jgi:hypothetical protein
MVAADIMSIQSSKDLVDVLPTPFTPCRAYNASFAISSVGWDCYSVWI